MRVYRMNKMVFFPERVRVDTGNEPCFCSRLFDVVEYRGKDVRTQTSVLVCFIGDIEGMYLSCVGTVFNKSNLSTMTIQITIRNTFLMIHTIF